MRVIGTAGHVDHGKSTLIAALTGVHPDRLKEEQNREMTIDLGFGWLTLPSGEEIGIVDVPGHRDFIENMLAGVGGIDAALLVIAADEGVMPQTREHLAILDLLGIPSGVVALTKTDLTPDAEWLDLVTSDIRALLRGTVLADAPIVPVSAKSGVGLDELVQTLAQVLQATTPRLDHGRPRLPIDRVFSMAGFGTVVTGTLIDGSLEVGEEVEVLPSGRRGRVRGLQTHKKKVERAVPGSRTAINLSGIAVDEIRRGEVVTRPNQYQPTRRVDVAVRLLRNVSQPLKHAAEVKVFLTTAETMARVRLLNADELVPGVEGWVQLELRDPLVAVRGDRIILRRPSPSETLGGGVIIDPHPKSRHKRFDQRVTQSLETLARGAPTEVLLEAALSLGPAPVKQVLAHSQLNGDMAAAALNDLLSQGRLIWLEESGSTWTPDSLVVPAVTWKALQEKALRLITEYHRMFPLRRGMPREELKSKLSISAQVFQALLAGGLAAGLLKEEGTAISLAEHRIAFRPEQQAKVQALLRRFAERPFAPPSLKECEAEVGQEVLRALLEVGELIAVSPEVVFRKADYDGMVERIRAAIQKRGTITLAEVRDLFGTSRKYAQALLEYLDSIGVTVRQGEARHLR